MKIKQDFSTHEAQCMPRIGTLSDFIIIKLGNKKIVPAKFSYLNHYADGDRKILQRNDCEIANQIKIAKNLFFYQ